MNNKISGSTSSGKTLLMCGLAGQIAGSSLRKEDYNKENVVYISGEMPAIRVMSRIPDASMLHKLGALDIYNYNIVSTDYNKSLQGLADIINHRYSKTYHHVFLDDIINMLIFKDNTRVSSEVVIEDLRNLIKNKSIKITYTINANRQDGFDMNETFIKTTHY
jgi:RecA-family ATPase